MSSTSPDSQEIKVDQRNGSDAVERHCLTVKHLKTRFEWIFRHNNFWRSEVIIKVRNFFGFSILVRNDIARADPLATSKRMVLNRGTFSRVNEVRYRYVKKFWKNLFSLRNESWFLGRSSPEFCVPINFLHSWGFDFQWWEINVF